MEDQFKKICITYLKKGMIADYKSIEDTFDKKILHFDSYYVQGNNTFLKQFRCYSLLKFSRLNGVLQTYHDCSIAELMELRFGKNIDDNSDDKDSFLNSTSDLIIIHYPSITLKNNDNETLLYDIIRSRQSSGHETILLTEKNLGVKELFNHIVLESDCQSTSTFNSSW